MVPLTQQHFTRWLQLWREALDARFAGPVTEEAAAHATRIAAAIAKHLDVASASASGPAAPGRGRPGLPLVARRDDLVQASPQPGGTSRRQA